jgi:arylsulfatase A-like enzyme
MLPEVPEGACAYLETPSLERLAEAGMRFGVAYAPAPNCTPTRRSLQCGLTPARQRGTEFTSEFVPADHPTIPTSLRAADPRYVCGHFGKWGEIMGSTPEECGYDETDGATYLPSHAPGEAPPAKGPRHAHRDDDEEIDGEAPLESPDPKATFSVAERASDFLERRARDGRPFYLQVSTYALHRPIQARPETLGKYESKGRPPRTFPPSFAAMVEDTDAALGMLLDRLDELGLRDRTYVFFTSDNGGTEFDRSSPLYLEHEATRRVGAGGGARPRRGPAESGEEPRLPANHPLRGSKQRLYEGGLRVPLVVAGPGIPPGTVCREPVVLWDLMPTLVDLAGGGGLPADVDGVSFRPLLGGASASLSRPAGLVFHRPRLGYTALREGDRKLIVEWSDAGEPAGLELFDLAEDPGELRDLAAEDPEGCDAMKERLLGWLAAAGAETPSDFRRP